MTTHTLLDLRPFHPKEFYFALEQKKDVRLLQYVMAALISKVLEEGHNNHKDFDDFLDANLSKQTDMWLDILKLLLESDRDEFVIEEGLFESLIRLESQNQFFTLSLLSKVSTIEFLIFKLYDCATFIKEMEGLLSKDMKIENFTHVLFLKLCMHGIDIENMTEKKKDDIKKAKADLIKLAKDRLKKGTSRWILHQFNKRKLLFCIQHF